jgi:hypothetical protein
MRNAVGTGLGDRASTSVLETVWKRYKACSSDDSSSLNPGLTDGHLAGVQFELGRL